MRLTRCRIAENTDCWRNRLLSTLRRRRTWYGKLVREKRICVRIITRPRDCYAKPYMRGKCSGNKKEKPASRTISIFALHVLPFQYIIPGYFHRVVSSRRFPRSKIRLRKASKQAPRNTNAIEEIEALLKIHTCINRRKAIPAHFINYQLKMSEYCSAPFLESERAKRRLRQFGAHDKIDEDGIMGLQIL